MCRNICGLPSVLFGVCTYEESLTRHLFPSLPPIGRPFVVFVFVCACGAVGDGGHRSKVGCEQVGLVGAGAREFLR